MVWQNIRRYFLLSFLVFTLFWAYSLAQPGSSTAASGPQTATEKRDGQHDFDPLIGSWSYHLKRLQNPLTGSKTWVEWKGTGVCYKIWDGRAQLDTIELDGPTGHFEGLTVRMYDPESHQWRLYWANS